MDGAQPKRDPRVTIVMTARERHALTLEAIESIVRHTAKPYRLIYADSAGPDWLWQALERNADAWGLEIVRFDEALWPNQMRKRIAPTIATDYAVFLDNDVTVEPGWLEKLVACADETGAAIVCPVYLVGGAGMIPKIHMAGGVLKWSGGPGAQTLEETHRFVDRYPADVAKELTRGPCDFGEYHCMLMRSDLIRDGAAFDENIVCVHEHIDTALSLKKSGRPIVCEPAAHVAYMAVTPFTIGDVPFFRARWSRAAAEQSIAAFCAKWGVADDEPSFGGIRQFLDSHASRVDLLRGAPNAQSSEPMRAEELQQTPAGLFELSRRMGYDADEWSRVDKAYRVAMMLMNGFYRPCGRPFLNHLTGTASVLMRYNFKAPIVTAGLLHAAYTHRPDLGREDAGGSELVRILGGRHPLQQRISRYAQRSRNWKDLLAGDAPAHALTVEDSEILAIAAANELDMHLSGEFRFSGRRDLDPPEIMALMDYVCDTAGVAGLSETLRREREELARIPPGAQKGPRVSFRIAAEPPV